MALRESKFLQGWYTFIYSVKIAIAFLYIQDLNSMQLMLLLLCLFLCLQDRRSSDEPVEETANQVRRPRERGGSDHHHLSNTDLVEGYPECS